MDFRLLRQSFLARPGNRLYSHSSGIVPFRFYGPSCHLATTKNSGKCKRRQSLFSGKCPPGKERLDLLPGRRDPVFSRDRTLAIGADAGAGIFVFIRPGAGAVRACQTGRHL